MALIHDTTIGGGHYPAAYTVIDTLRFDRLGAHLWVLTFADEQAKVTGENPVLCRGFDTETERMHGEVFALAYAYLKTLPEFAGATDHLEPDGRHIN